MTSRSSFLALLSGAFVALSALPDAAQAQRCAVAEVEVPALQIRVGAREQLLVIFRDRTGIPCDTDPAFTATSSNAAVARIDRTGGVWTVVGVAPGAAAITVRTGAARTARSGIGTVVVQAQDLDTGQSLRPQPTPIVEVPQPVNRDPVVATPGGATLRYQVRTSTTPAIGIITTPARLQLLPGEASFLRYQTADITGAQAEALPLQFQVEPSAALRFVQVDSIGVVSTTDTGTATIRVTAIGRSNVRPALVPVEVRADSVRFVRSVVSMAPGTVDTIRLRVVDQNREIALGQVYQFSSSDTAVARVHLFQPVVEARSPGTVVVTASNARLPQIQVTVQVFRPITAIQLPDSQVTIAIRQQRRVVMRPVIDDTTFVREAPRAISGLDTTRVAAAYDTVTGAWQLTGRNAGETSITMAVQNGRDSSTIIRRTLRIRVVAGGLALSRTRVGLGPGERTPVTVTVLDDRRQPIPGLVPVMTWTSSDTAVARFENDNVVARGVGRARLTGRTEWDSMAVVDVYVVSDMLIVKQQRGAWNVFGRSAAATWTQLTNDSLVESFPAFSRDLTRVAWSVRPAGRPRGGQIVVANADGSDPRVVVSQDSAAVIRPQFVGPAGERLVFELQLPDGRSELWTVGVDGRSPSRLTAGPPGAFVGFPAVSPDGQRLLYVSLRPGTPGHYDIYRSAIDGSGEARMTTWPRADEAPVWAPDGQSFFFLRDEGDVNRRPSKRVFHFDLANDSVTAVSPAGTYVSAFGLSGDGRTLLLHTTDIGTATTRLATLEVPSGTLTPIALDVGEILPQASPSAMRPVTPQPAAGAAPPSRP